jgi:endonuclease/exonuclease/phosphatase family metal-dependent hydrolase
VDKVKYIAWYVRRHNIDVLFLQDTQLTTQTAHWRKAELKQELGEDCYITSSAREESQLYTSIGGQMVIVMPRWAPDIANVDTTDASSMGVVMAVYLKTKIGTLMIISTYWPYDSDPAGNGLAAGLTRWMEKCNRSGSAMDYIQDRIHRLILNQQANSSNATIVCGDFNACYHKHAGCKVSKQKAAERIESLADEVTKEAQEINLVINDKPPSKAFKKNWSRRQAGRGRGQGSKKGAHEGRELDPEALKLISSQRSFEPWATHCCLVNPVADYCHSNNRIMYTRYCGEVGTGHIDHQLHFPMNLTCTSFHTTVSAQWTALGITDHRPISAGYNVVGGGERKRRGKSLA